VIYWDEEVRRLPFFEEKYFVSRFKTYIESETVGAHWQRSNGTKGDCQEILRKLYKKLFWPHISNAFWHLRIKFGKRITVLSKFGVGSKRCSIYKNYPKIFESTFQGWA
jgi:hypothetical protein